MSPALSSIAFLTTPVTGSLDRRRYLTPSSINSGPVEILVGILKDTHASRHAFSSDSVIGIDEVDLNIFCSFLREVSTSSTPVVYHLNIPGAMGEFPGSAWAPQLSGVYLLDFILDFILDSYSYVYDCTILID